MSARVDRIVAWALGSVAFRRTRTVLTVLSIGLATALVASTIGFRRGYENALRHNVDAMGYQVLVTGKGCPHEAATLILRGGSIPMYIQEDVYRHIASQPEVKDSTRFFMQSVPRDDGKSYQLHVGIDESFLALKPDVEFQRGGWFSGPTPDEAILGYNVAEYLRLGIGDTVDVQGRAMRVHGVLDKLGTQDDGTIFLPLEVAQDLFGRRDRLTGVGLRLHDVTQAGGLSERLYEVPSIQVVRMAQVQSTLLAILESARGLLVAFGGFCLFVALLGVFNVALLSSEERRGEMGVMRALGCSTARLFALVWSESLVLGVLGGATGVAFTFLASGSVTAFARSTLAFVPSGAAVELSAPVLLGSSALAIALCLLAGGYPAWKSSRVSPMVSIRGARG